MFLSDGSYRAAALVSGFVLCGSVSASVLDDFNSGILVADFLFDDVAGTTIDGAANSANPLATFDVDADSADVVTNGSGQLDASLKANTAFGSNYVDLDAIDSGRVIALMDVTYSFDDQIFDSAQDEEFRLTLITNDPRSTFVTAEIFFQRTSATEVTLYGNGVGTGASDTPDVILAGGARVLTLLDVDLDADVFELFYSFNDGATFTSAGTGTLDPTRGIESVRMVLNEDFSNDTLLIDRFAVAIIPEPASVALLGLGGLMLGRRRA
ncbi:MAG: PEP-CTERM sorting domain-containing protein [Phycisphaeraceae bacterium]